MQISLDLISRLNCLLHDCPASITSLIRTPLRNKEEGGAPKSGHVSGEAVDLVFDSITELVAGSKRAVELGFKGIEMDLVNNHLHLDMKDRIWHVVKNSTGEYPLESFTYKI